jgi:hypothetical protein
MALIAKVTVLAAVNGVRTEFAPGATLPELSPHDVEALKAMGAIEDTAESDKAAKAAAAADKAAGKEFAEARRKVQAEQASLAT